MYIYVSSTKEVVEVHLNDTGQNPHLLDDREILLKEIANRQILANPGRKTWGESRWIRYPSF